MTTLAEKGFRALCAMVLEVSKQTMVKKAARNKMAEKGPKNFSRFMRRGTRGDQVEKGDQV